MMKAAIIGCGYVGSAIAQKWQTQGLDVLATTTRSERIGELLAIAQQAKVLQGNDAKQMQTILADRQIALLCVGSKKGASYADTYLGTAQTLAQVLPDTAVQHLIYTSTSSVYGHQQGSWVSEAMPPQPATENGKIIAATEQTLLAAATPQRKVCILRLGGIYGPERTLEKIYSRAAGTTRPGKGEQATNWVHLSDIVGAIDWARQQQLEGIYNVVQDEIPTVRELIGRVCDRYHLTPVQWDETQPSTRSYNVRISNAKLKRTGYLFVHPTFDL